MNTNFLDFDFCGLHGGSNRQRCGDMMLFSRITTTDVHLTWNFIVFGRIDNL